MKLYVYEGVLRPYFASLYPPEEYPMKKYFGWVEGSRISGGRIKPDVTGTEMNVAAMGFLQKD